MDLAIARALLSDEGAAALEAAQAEGDPTSLGAATRLRSRFSPELAAAAVGQVELRRRARAKFGVAADGMFFTPAALEQATRAPVAAWRAQRLAAQGAHAVVDLGCGIGADALAFAAAGLDVIAVERDPATALLAERNLAGKARVVCADAEEFDIPSGFAAYLDPARRDDAGRVWGIDGLSPSWDFSLATLRAHGGVAKVGPGISHAVIPDACRAEWVSDHGDVVECGLWFGAERGMAATRLDRDGATHHLIRDAAADAPPATGFRGCVAEPDGAALRAGCLPQLAAQAQATLVGDRIAYLAANAPAPSPWLTWFAVDDVLPYDVKALRRYLADHRVGTVEIKKRGVDVDPATLRRQLKPKGPGAATLLLAPTPDGVRVAVGHRL